MFAGATYIALNIIFFSKINFHWNVYEITFTISNHIAVLNALSPCYSVTTSGPTLIKKKKYIYIAYVLWILKYL